MVQAKNLEGIVCLKHPNTPAIARCATCGRPLCQECMKTKDGIICCSDECLKNALASLTKVDNFVASKKRVEKNRMRGILVNLIILVIIIVLIFIFRDYLLELLSRIR